MSENDNTQHVMNENIRKLAEAATTYYPSDENSGEYWRFDMAKFADLIIRECSKLNLQQAYELEGVVVDVREDGNFDDVCLATVERVRGYLASGLQNHFGIDNE